MVHMVHRHKVKKYVISSKRFLWPLKSRDSEGIFKFYYKSFGFLFFYSINPNTLNESIKELSLSPSLMFLSKTMVLLIGILSDAIIFISYSVLFGLHSIHKVMGFYMVKYKIIYE